MKFTDFLLNESYPAEMYQDIKPYSKEIGDWFAHWGKGSVQNKDFYKLEIEKSISKSGIFKEFKTGDSDIDAIYGQAKLFCVMIHSTGGVSAHICEWSKTKILKSVFDPREFGNCGGKVVKCWFTRISSSEISNLDDLMSARRKEKWSGQDPLLRKNYELQQAIAKSSTESSVIKEVKSLCKSANINITNPNEFEYDFYVSEYVKTYKIKIRYYIDSNKYVWIEGKNNNISEKEYNNKIEIGIGLFTPSYSKIEIEDIINHCDNIKKLYKAFQKIESSTYKDIFPKE